MISHTPQWRGLVTAALSPNVTADLADQYAQLVAYNPLSEALASIVAITLRLKFPEIKPKFTTDAETGALYALLGLALDRDDLKQTALEIAHYRYLLHHTPQSADPLLFHATGLSKPPLPPDTYLRLLHEWLTRLPAPEPQTPPTTLCAHGAIANSLAAITLNGPVLGAIGTTTFASHLAPLGDPRYFGVEGGQIHPINATLTDSGFHISGTVRAAAPHFSGEWLEIEAELHGDTLNLFALPSATGDDIRFMAFVAYANRCFVGEQEIRPASLDKYAGSTDLVTLEGTTIVGPETGVEVVPLGGAHYGEGRFLIAYPLLERKSYEWKITAVESVQREDQHLQSAAASSFQE